MHLLPNHTTRLSVLYQGSHDDILFISFRNGPILYRWQILELVFPDAKGCLQLICTDVVDAWLELLVKYANSAIIDTKGGLFYVLPIAFFDHILTQMSSGLAEASEKFTAIGLSRILFFSAYCILLPLDLPIGGPAEHTILIAAFPQRKTIILYDSWRPKNISRGRRLVSDLVHFLGFHLGELWIVEDWKIGLAKGPWQRNKVDCGVWACSNAWRVVFGHACTADTWKMRRRMATDILNNSLIVEEPVPTMVSLCSKIPSDAKLKRLNGFYAKKATKDSYEGRTCRGLSLENFRPLTLGIRAMLTSRFLRA